MSMARVFVAYGEGGVFRAAFMRIPARPKYIVPEFKNSRCVILFKCGMIYDDNIRRFGLSPWRHKVSGGRREGKKYYKRVAAYWQFEQDNLHWHSDNP